MASIGSLTIHPFPLILAPMEDVTDSSYRTICKQFGADIVVSEFVSSEGLIRDAEKSKTKLFFEETERPIFIQIFGHTIDGMRKAAEIAAMARPDGLDLNFGCPVKKVVSKGAGAALLKDIPKMVRMAEEVVRSVTIPVTAKTRIGWDHQNLPVLEVAERLQDAGIAALTIHGRTAVQLYGGKADWTLIGAVKNNQRMRIPVFGNGDISNPVIALERKETYGIDGLMIGRGAIGNPWLFGAIKAYVEQRKILPDPSLEERIRVMKQHMQKSIQVKGEKRTILEFRKFYSGYLRGIPEIKPYRMQLMKAGSPEEVESVFKDISRLRETLV